MRRRASSVVLAGIFAAGSAPSCAPVAAPGASRDGGEPSSVGSPREAGALPKVPEADAPDAAPAQIDPDGNDDDEDPGAGKVPGALRWEKVGTPPLALTRICDLTPLHGSLYAAHAHQPLGDWNLPVVLYPAITSVFAALAVATSALTSRVIFGLRARVDRATRLGQYVLEEKIGAGGMGVVYRARHAMLRRPTAIKLLDPARAGDDSLARFEREVRTTSRLTHPNTVAVYDYGRTQDGTFYYAMELLDGLTLEQLVRFAGPLPPGRVIKLLDQICGSLSEAHEAGLVHRDVKPANIMICERSGSFDVVKVLDFGLVKEMDRTDVGAHTRRSLAPDADPLKTEANVVMGTPLYLAPEAIRRRPVDARTDLYAVGCVAYYLLTGTDAFAGPNLDAVLESHVERKPESPSARLREHHPEHRGVPEDLELIVLACLAKVPSDRPQSARELRAALLACTDRASWSEEDARAWWQAKPSQERATRELENAPTETLIIDWSSRLEGASAASAARGNVGPREPREPPPSPGDT